MKKIILTLIIIVLTILNIVLFKINYTREMQIKENKEVEINL